MLMRVLDLVAAQPWAIRRDYGQQMLAVLLRRAAEVRLPAAEVGDIVAGQPGRVAVTAPQTVAVIPILGIVAHRASMVQGISGPRGTSTEAVTNSLRQALADPSVSAIVFDVDSPGGGVYGVPELAEEIRAARGRKPLVAVANAEAASAAYWLASQADEVVVTPSGLVGSIGVYTYHEDISAWADKHGIRTTFVYAGTHKIEGHPFAPLADDARATMQRRVDAYYHQFVTAVGAGRGVSPEVAASEQFGAGRVFNAHDAVRAGLADRVATFDEVIEELASGTWADSHRARAAAAQTRTKAAALAETAARTTTNAHIDLARRAAALEALR